MSELERIFLAALEIPEPQRDAFITNECGQNHALTRDVQSLLSHHRQETIPFSEILQPVATDLFNTASTATGIQPGQMLGPYRVERKVGEGGMGTVYAATDTRLQRQVAIKLLKRTFGDRSGALARFHKEARSAAALAHPNIATLYDFSESEGAPWMVMEFVDGASLRSKLTTQPFDAATILRYATQLAAALEHAHSRGIVHRDIKPENILIASDGTLKVIDFGIADALRETPLDAKGAFFGTLAYSAPELLAGGAVNEASDIYSCGAVVYEMGCGVHTGTVANHVNAATRNPALPANLASLIDRCLAPDPAGRYRNGGKLATALRSLSTIAQVSPEAVPALAILDFTNLAGEHALDWLGAGIAETLAARLSKLNSLRVATRSLVHQAAARLGVNDPSTIGRHLEAKWVVTGSFLKVADRVRITPQLIEAATGETSFAETIDGKWDDIFDLQDKAAQALANHLGGAGPQSPLPSLSRNLLAY